MAGRLGFRRSKWFQTQHEEESSRAGRLFKAAKLPSQGKGSYKVDDTVFSRDICGISHVLESPPKERMGSCLSHEKKQRPNSLAERHLPALGPLESGITFHSRDEPMSTSWEVGDWSSSARTSKKWRVAQHASASTYLA